MTVLVMDNNDPQQDKRESLRDSLRATERDDGRTEDGIVLTPEQQRARRSRSIALAVALFALVVLFYIVTLVKGPGVLVRPL